MRDHQPRSLPTRTQTFFYVLTFFVGGLIRNTSLLILILFFGLAAAAAAVNTSKSFWYNPGFRDFVTSLEAKIADFGASPTVVEPQPKAHFRDPEKAQKDEIRRRRNLVKEMKQRKASLSSSKNVVKNGRKL